MASETSQNDSQSEKTVPDKSNPHKSTPEESTSAKQQRTSLLSIFKILWVCLLVIAALLTFPTYLPWMIAASLLWATWRIFCGRIAWPLLLGCVTVVVIKRVPLTPTILLVICIMLAVAAIDRHRTKDSNRETDPESGIWTRSGRRIVITVFVCAWLLVAMEWQIIEHSSTSATLDAQRPVVCLGDSLTSGVHPHGGYPDRLRELISVPVVDCGRAGITTTDGLEFLPAIRAANPQAVVIELGGHDYLRKKTRNSTKANLVKIIEVCREIDAEVILVEIPRGFIMDPFHGLEREIAREHDVELLADGAIRQLIYWGPAVPPGKWSSAKSHLSVDGLHPNGNGNVYLARRVSESLQRIFGPQILAKSN
jgi:acyl-CoA thioesterase-1